MKVDEFFFSCSGEIFLSPELDTDENITNIDRTKKCCTHFKFFKPM